MGCRLTRQVAQRPVDAHNLAIGKVYWRPGNASQVHMSLSGKRIMPTEGHRKTWARKTNCWRAARQCALLQSTKQNRLPTPPCPCSPLPSCHTTGSPIAAASTSSIPHRPGHRDIPSRKYEGLVAPSETATEQHLWETFVARLGERATQSKMKPAQAQRHR